jgi:hypothetical protein
MLPSLLPGRLVVRDEGRCLWRQVWNHDGGGKHFARLNPQMTFVYVSGAGTDSTEKGRSLCVRVKGRTENAPLQLPFKAAYMFRPGDIEPGVRSKTASYRFFYALNKPLLPPLRWAFPDAILTCGGNWESYVDRSPTGCSKPYPRKQGHTAASRLKLSRRTCGWTLFAADFDLDQANRVECQQAGTLFKTISKADRSVHHTRRYNDCTYWRGTLTHMAGSKHTRVSH